VNVLEKAHHPSRLGGAPARAMIETDNIQCKSGDCCSITICFRWFSHLPRSRSSDSYSNLRVANGYSSGSCVDPRKLASCRLIRSLRLHNDGVLWVLAWARESSGSDVQELNCDNLSEMNDLLWASMLLGFMDGCTYDSGKVHAPI
jgi:hypothetical protein